MIGRRLAKALSQGVRVTWVAAGFALVFAACCGTAQAFAPAQGPEIDPGTASSALAFLTGAALLLTDRLRRKK